MFNSGRHLIIERYTPDSSIEPERVLVSDVTSIQLGVFRILRECVPGMTLTLEREGTHRKTVYRLVE